MPRRCAAHLATAAIAFLLVIGARAGALDISPTTLIDSTANLTLAVTTTTAGTPLTPTNHFAVNFTTGGTAFYLHEIDLYAALSSGSATVILEATVSLLLGSSRSAVANATVSMCLTGSTTGSVVRIKLSDSFLVYCMPRPPTGLSSCRPARWRRASSCSSLARLRERPSL